MTEKQNKGGETLKGDPALNAIMAQLKLIQTQQRQIAHNLTSLKESTDEKFNLFQAELVREKATAEQGLNAAMEQMYKNMEAKRVDPATLNQMIEDARNKIEKDLVEKRARFQEELKTSVLGTVINYEAITIPLTINRVTFNIKPGVNLDIPAPFIELWENRADAARYAEERNAAITGEHSFGHLENWIAQGRTVSIGSN